VVKINAEGKITFPNDFRWGVSSSSYQTEGAWDEDGKGESIWDRFTHTPGKTENGDTGDVACDHYHRYKEDVSLMKELGVQVYRFSISWPRVLPKGKGEINEPGLDFYNHLVDELCEAGIEPFACLYHWDLPQALQDEGGWANPKIVRYFSDYAEIVARELGDRVKLWAIFNEPRCVAWLGHLKGIHAPGIKDPEVAIKVSHNLMLTQGKAVQTLRDIYDDFQIGTILDFNAIHPIDDDEKNVAAARKLDEFLNAWFLTPVFKGEYPPIAREVGLKPSEEEMSLIRQPLDFLGVNYYTRLLAAHDPSEPITQAKVVKKNTPITEMGWEIYPMGLYEVLMRLKEDCDNPLIYVTESGAAFGDEVRKDGEIQDDDRIAFLRDHIVATYRAIGEGARVKGFLVWTLMDNLEWAIGYKMRFGLVHVDRKTLKRTPKKSFYWYREVIRNNGPSLFW